AFLRAWIAVVGAEMLAASDWGLGWVIFDAKEFLNADVMLAALAVIGAIGFLFERLVFGSIERATGMRWGMGRPGKGERACPGCGAALAQGRHLSAISFNARHGALCRRSPNTRSPARFSKPSGCASSPSSSPPRYWPPD